MRTQKNVQLLQAFMTTRVQCCHKFTQTFVGAFNLAVGPYSSDADDVGKPASTPAAPTIPQAVMRGDFEIDATTPSVELSSMTRA